MNYYEHNHTLGILIIFGWGRQGSIHHDEELFKQLPLNEDCPICMLPLPPMCTGRGYQPCCGKEICSGCFYAAVIERDKDRKCPFSFCRISTPNSEEELIERIRKRVDGGDANAIHQLGAFYYYGECGLPTDYTKAFGLFVQAGERGCAATYANIGNAYYYGNGGERDKKMWLGTTMS